MTRRSSAHTRLSSGRGSQRGHRRKNREKQSSGVLQEGCTLGPGVGVKVEPCGGVSAIEEMVKYTCIISMSFLCMHDS